MAINAGFAGREYPANAPYSVGREKLREFAAAVGSLHPVHHDLVAARGAGYPDLVAPPTFAVVVAQRAEAQLIEDPEAGIDFSRVVHADERFTHHRPIVAGDELVTVLHVDSIVERAGLAMVTTRCEILAESPGDDDAPVRTPVATVRSTLAVRGEDA
ncbi:MaoC family dehydratase N-terminal domain-containing protein [Cellulosimicrobium sp. Marseille-Q4280]|uniref:FAS1-like dehydratase domain-containing protein n=1 Tax=Cellulosimicrobium sp. Marseille-Q4280 TaxID=2937992 RepID=UPI00203BBFAD|nr:MaoC family dehydratase N-terminal domain-containing protein [Cellulosimicrobium sp. Marseille-Q4280]